MIKKLKSKIFILIMLSLSAIILGTIIIFTILNYTNTINTATMMIDRVTDIGVKKEPIENNSNIGEEKINIDTDIEGLYMIQVKDSEVIRNKDISYDQEIEQNAIKASNSKKEVGIIGKYIYKVRRTRDNTNMVILMENEEVITHIKTILVFAVIASIISLIIIYIIAKKVSELIVKPVEDTLEKQKQFISDASHELKTPLAVIEANADVLENEVKDNKWLKYIQNEIDSMDKLINELLLLTKIENVDSLKNYEEFNVSEETEMIISMFESMAYEKQIKINTDIQKDIKLNGNKEDIEHILSTLIDNAIKHTKPEKEISVELYKEKNNIILQVKNMGEPIPEDQREKIFERFYRIDKSRNRSEKRYGLGLAIAKSTVQKYNGKIEVSYKNGFTVFKVSIPN